MMLFGIRSRRIGLAVGGAVLDEWTEAEIVRDLKEFSGSFSFTLREAFRSVAAFPWASFSAAALVEPGAAVTATIDGEPVLVGYVETVDTDVDDGHAEVTIAGRDKAGDLVDCAAAPDGPSEYKLHKLEDVAAKIAQPFGLTVRSEIDTGKPFPRYAIDLSETGLSAIEKGARQRHALVLSDGVGAVLITRTGASRAPADLSLPGNVKAARRSRSHEKRHSETIVRGQSERIAGGREGRPAPMTAGEDPDEPGARQAGDGSATERERKGTAMTGRAKDVEIKRHRPKVHLTRSQPDGSSVGDEADWRMRSARAGSEEIVYTVHDYRAGGTLWKVNTLAFVRDRYHRVARDLLVSRTAMVCGEDGEVTELTLISPEAYDKGDVGGRRNDLPD